MAFNNHGAVEIQTGTLTMVGGGTHTGSFTVPAGSALNLAGGTHTASGGSSITGAGRFIVGGAAANLAGLVNVTGTNLFDAGTANLTGNYICTNNTLVISGGTANFNGTGTVTPSVVEVDSGTLGGSQNVTVLGQMNWSGGAMSGTGRTLIPPGASLTIDNTVALSNGRSLENGGTVLWTGGSIAVGGTVVVTNRAGALFETSHAGGLNYSGNLGGRFDNMGTFRKSASAGTTTLFTGMAFNNHGAVEIQTGILAANGGYTSTTGSLLHCAIGGTTVGTGYGRLQVAGTVTLNGALGVSFINAFLPTTNDTFTVLTAGTRAGTFTGFNYPSNLVTMLMSNTANSVIVGVSAVLGGSGPILHIEQITAAVARLYWSVNYPDFHLEYNTGLGTSNWAASALTPVVTGTNNVVTNSLSGAQKYYRLSRVPAPYTPLPPLLTIQTASPSAVRLLWSSDGGLEFTLHSNTNLATTNWIIDTTSPVLLGTNNAVTNAVVGPQRFYRLGRNTE